MASLPHLRSITGPVLPSLPGDDVRGFEVILDLLRGKMCT